MSNPSRVTWRLRKRPDGWRVVDVIVEGVSMAVTYRQEYATILNQQGGMPGSAYAVARTKRELGRAQSKAG